MKHYLFILVSFLISHLVSAQEDTYFIKWEGVSKNGHIIYGVSYTKEEAQFVIDDFNERNARTKYKIVFQLLKKRTTQDQNLVRNFYEEHPEKYRVLRALDITALHVFQIGNFDKAVEFLEESTGKSNIETQKYMHRLLKEYQLYRLEERAL